MNLSLELSKYQFILWKQHSEAEPVAPPAMGAKGYRPLCDAPGTYVLQS